MMIGQSKAVSGRHDLRTDGMAWIPGGNFLMGSATYYPEERPVRRVDVDGFFIDRSLVTNRDFSKFVAETGYVTVAERPIDPANYPGVPPEMLRPGSLVFIPQQKDWWKFVFGASWRHPAGPGSTVEHLADQPVAHVAFKDAESYAQWAGKVLPTETEWEFASRGGLDGATYCWGEDYLPEDRHMAYIWLGEFPVTGGPAGGTGATTPVGAFPPNGYGLHDMAGNVWEWTADWYRDRHQTQPAKTCCSSDTIGEAAVKSFEFFATGHSHSEKSPQGRLVPLRSKLLPSVSACR